MHQMTIKTPIVDGQPNHGFILDAMLDEAVKYGLMDQDYTFRTIQVYGEDQQFELVWGHEFIHCKIEYI